MKFVEYGQRQKKWEFRLSKDGIVKSLILTVFVWGLLSITKCWTVLLIGSNGVALSWSFEIFWYAFRTWIIPYTGMMILAGILIFALFILIVKDRYDLNDTDDENLMPIGQAISTIQILLLTCFVTICASIWLMPINFPNNVQIPATWIRVIAGITQGIFSASCTSWAFFNLCRTRLSESHWKERPFMDWME